MKTQYKMSRKLKVVLIIAVITLTIQELIWFIIPQSDNVVFGSRTLNLINGYDSYKDWSDTITAGVVFSEYYIYNTRYCRGILTINEDLQYPVISKQIKPRSILGYLFDSFSRSGFMTLPNSEDGYVFEYEHNGTNIIATDSNTYRQIMIEVNGELVSAYQ